MDRILNCKLELDEKSRKFAIADLIDAGTPITKLWDCAITLDQGREGSCVGHAWAHELISDPVPVIKGIDHKFATEQLYWMAQRVDQWAGGAYPEASRRERYEGTSVLAGAKATMMTGLIGGYHWAFGLDDLILGIGYRGPSVIGVNWYRNMQDVDADGFIHVSGKKSGGHAILVRGVDIEKEFFTLRNSWGEEWGRSGDCYVSFSDMERLLKEDGVACFATGRRAAMAVV